MWDNIYPNGFTKQLKLVDLFDFDGDGLDDLFTSGSGWELFHKNVGGFFESVYPQNRLPTSDGIAQGWAPAIADYDSDGLLDYLTHTTVSMQTAPAWRLRGITVYRQVGDGMIEIVAPPNGEFSLTEPYFTMFDPPTVPDLDGDGNPDRRMFMVGPPGGTNGENLCNGYDDEGWPHCESFDYTPAGSMFEYTTSPFADGTSSTQHAPGVSYADGLALSQRQPMGGLRMFGKDGSVRLYISSTWQGNIALSDLALPSQPPVCTVLPCPTGYTPPALNHPAQLHDWSGWSAFRHPRQINPHPTGNDVATAWGIAGIPGNIAVVGYGRDAGAVIDIERGITLPLEPIQPFLLSEDLTQPVKMVESTPVWVDAWGSASWPMREGLER